jgi:hypothetical protein
VSDMVRLKGGSLEICQSGARIVSVSQGPDKEVFPGSDTEMFPAFCLGRVIDKLNVFMGW